MTQAHSQGLNYYNNYAQYSIYAGLLSFVGYISLSPGTFMEDFEKGSFMKTLDDLEETLELIPTSAK